MDCDVNYYFCKNLLYWDLGKCGNYICTITGKECKCKNSDFQCFAFEGDNEE